MRKHHLPSVDMSPCTMRSPKSSSIRVTSQPRPVASGQLILTSLSVSLSPPYTSLQEACYRTSAMTVLMCWQLQSAIVVLCCCNARKRDAVACTASDSKPGQLLVVSLLVTHKTNSKLVCTLAGAPSMCLAGSRVTQGTLSSEILSILPDRDDFFLSFHTVLKKHLRLLLATAARACRGGCQVRFCGEGSAGPELNMFWQWQPDYNFLKCASPPARLAVNTGTQLSQLKAVLIS